MKSVADEPKVGGLKEFRRIRSALNIRHQRVSTPPRQEIEEHFANSLEDVPNGVEAADYRSFVASLRIAIKRGELLFSELALRAMACQFRKCSDVQDDIFKWIVSVDSFVYDSIEELTASAQSSSSSVFTPSATSSSYFKCRSSSSSTSISSSTTSSSMRCSSPQPLTSLDLGFDDSPCLTKRATSSSARVV